VYYSDVGEKIDGYWRLVDPVWEQIDIYSGAGVFLETYTAANREAGLLFAAHFAQSEICNGGFKQLFSNSTGVLVPEAVEGFRVIGMGETANILSAAMRLLGESYPRERGERQSVLAGLDKETLNRLDEKFFVLIETENGGFIQSADKFVSQLLD
jgi:Domain of unknown function (DUF4375)